MATIRPFLCIRPSEGKAAKIAALPYDVYNRKEAKEVVAKNPDSFLKIDRAETQFDDSKVLERRNTLIKFINGDIASHIS